MPDPDDAMANALADLAELMEEMAAPSADIGELEARLLEIAKKHAAETHPTDRIPGLSTWH
jgi:hypothetical protein